MKNTKTTREQSSKQWWIVDNATHSRSSVFETPISAKTKKEAMITAKAEWDKLTDSEKRSRDDFALAYAGVYEDGCLDYSNIVAWISLKKHD